jgi:3-phenylpropionate/trans-cinnamate dioxygenase ferredoxin subunit
MFSTKIKWVKIAENQEDLRKQLHSKNCQPIVVNNIGCLLIWHKEAFYLVKNKCPHQGIKLTGAHCEDGFIVCPWHRYGFDLKTGRGAGLYLENYPIEEREDGFYAGFEYFSWFGE